MHITAFFPRIYNVADAMQITAFSSGIYSLGDTMHITASFHRIYNLAVAIAMQIMARFRKGRQSKNCHVDQAFFSRIYNYADT